MLFNNVPGFNCIFVALKSRIFVLKPWTDFRLNFVRDLCAKDCQIRGHPAYSGSLWGRRLVLDLSAVQPSLFVIQLQ
jgi:hypothetical protein